MLYQRKHKYFGWIRNILNFGIYVSLSDGVTGNLCVPRSVVAQKDISDIVKPGVGLAFLAYPEIASNLPFKQLWAFLFFLMITILGLDSQVCMVEGLFTALEGGNTRRLDEIHC